MRLSGGFGIIVLLSKAADASIEIERFERLNKQYDYDVQEADSEEPISDGNVLTDGLPAEAEKTAASAGEKLRGTILKGLTCVCQQLLATKNPDGTRARDNKCATYWCPVLAKSDTCDTKLSRIGQLERCVVNQNPSECYIDLEWLQYPSESLNVIRSIAACHRSD